MKTSFSRTFATLVIILLTALILVGVALQTLVKGYLKEIATQELRTDGQVIVDLAQAYYDKEPISQQEFYIALRITDSIGDADAILCDANGTLLLCADSPFGCEHQGMQLDSAYLEKVFQKDGVTSTGIIQGLYSGTRYVVSLPVCRAGTGERLGIVIMSSPTASTEMVMSRMMQYFTWVSVLAVLGSVVLMVFFVRQQNGPLLAMARVARTFGHGDLSARVKTGGNSSAEVEELALAFNNMASSLQKSEYQRREFVANVSHELKTPMTTISGYVDGILDGTIPPDKVESYLQIVSNETKRLNRLVRSMLDISRLQDQGGVPEEQKTRFDVGECVGQVLITFEQKINDKNLQVEVDFPEHPLYALAAQDPITQVVYNLTDNAVKFCPPGGTLSLSVRQGGSKIYVSVANEGETIPPEELPLVFDRFHKIDKSRSQNRDSWGLGLYIVKTIVCSHGEDISVTSRDGKTTFTFTLSATS